MLAMPEPPAMHSRSSSSSGRQVALPSGPNTSSVLPVHPGPNHSEKPPTGLVLDDEVQTIGLRGEIDHGIRAVSGEPGGREHRELSGVERNRSIEGDVERVDVAGQGPDAGERAGQAPRPPGAAGIGFDARRDEDLAIAERDALAHEELASLALQAREPRRLRPHVLGPCRDGRAPCRYRRSPSRTS